MKWKKNNKKYGIDQVLKKRPILWYFKTHDQLSYSNVEAVLQLSLQINDTQIWSNVTSIFERYFEVFSKHKYCMDMAVDSLQ